MVKSGPRCDSNLLIIFLDRMPYHTMQDFSKRYKNLYSNFNSVRTPWPPSAQTSMGPEHYVHLPRPYTRVPTYKAIDCAAAKEILKLSLTNFT